MIYLVHVIRVIRVIYQEIIKFTIFFHILKKKKQQSYNQVSSLQKKIIEIDDDVIRLQRKIADINKLKTKQLNKKRNYYDKIQQIFTYNDTIIDSLLNQTLPKCSICLGEISENCIAITECGHMFCKNCLTQSLRFNNKCAICRCEIDSLRVSLVSISNQEEEETLSNLTTPPLPRAPPPPSRARIRIRPRLYPQIRTPPTPTPTPTPLPPPPPRRISRNRTQPLENITETTETEIVITSVQRNPRDEVIVSRARRTSNQINEANVALRAVELARELDLEEAR